MQPVGARRTFLKTGAILALVVGAVFAGFPVFWMLSSSFKSNSENFRLSRHECGSSGLGFVG